MLITVIYIRTENYYVQGWLHLAEVWHLGQAISAVEKLDNVSMKLMKNTFHRLVQKGCCPITLITDNVFPIGETEKLWAVDLCRSIAGSGTYKPKPFKAWCAAIYHADTWIVSGPLIIRDGKLAWEVTNLFVQDASRGDGILSEYVVEFSALTSVLTSVPASLSSPNHPLGKFRQIPPLPLLRFCQSFKYQEEK